LIWNYHDDDIPVPAALVDLVVRGLPENAPRASVEHFRVDADHSNSYAEWKRMGSPQSLSSTEYQRLEHAGQLQLLGSPSWVSVDNGEVHLHFTLPQQGLSLAQVPQFEE